ncbi:MAG: CHRD domain-containing protein [Solirubrobacteraceae bacterium]
MNRRRLQLVLGFGVAMLLAAVGVAVAGGGQTNVRETLTGYEEIPTLSTPGNGSFEARISRFSDRIDYELSYADTESAVTQAHIHLGARAFNGGISAFLCTNLGNGPEGTPACPPAPATVTGTIEPEDVVGPADQGIAPGEFDELVDAIRAGATYANVHTTGRPGGEIRAQLDERGRHGDD